MSHRQEKDGESFESAQPESSEASFVRRWSRRKRDAAAGVGQVDPAEVPDADEPEETSALGAESSAAALTDADMPAIESLDEGSEYDGFLSPGVSEELRRLALRKLFHLPGFNVRDGLDDYDEDFTRFAALGDVMTQDLRHRLKTAAKRETERGQQSISVQEPAAESVPSAEGRTADARNTDLAEAEEFGGDEPGGDLPDPDERERG